MAEQAEVRYDARTRRRAVVTGGIGNFIEWYDFVLYGFFASVIATLFFPSEDPVASLLAAFAVFGIGYFVRPLGAFVFGHYGDRFGRRNTLSVVVIMMAAASLIIGAVPTYEQIGILAPVILLLGRVLQGLSAGGEYGGAASLMVEYSPENRRGLFGSWQSFSTGCGVLAGSLTAALATAVLPEATLYSWGWRVPFLIGVPLAFVGLYLRLRIEETPDFRAAAEAQELTSVPLKEVFVTYPRSILTALGLGLAVTISTQYLIAYIPSQLREVETLSVSELLITNVIALVAYTGVMPFVAMLSDRIGRRPVLLTVAIGFVTLTYPIFMLLSAQTLSSILAAQVLLATLAGSGLALLPATLAELFPTRVRYSGVGIGYSFPVAIFGGVTPFMATLLVSVTGNNLAPSFYLIAGALGTLIVVYFMRESYRVTFHRGSEDPAIRRTSDATLVEKE